MTRSTRCRRSGTSRTELDPSTGAHATRCSPPGSGITPILSIVSTILAAEPHRTVSLAVRQPHVSRSAMLLDELQDVRDRHLGRLSIAFAFTREEIGGELLSGRPDRERIERLDRGRHPARRRRPRVPVRSDRHDRRRPRRARSQPGCRPISPPRDLHDQAAGHGDASRRRRSPRRRSPWRPVVPRCTGAPPRSTSTTATACSTPCSESAPTRRSRAAAACVPRARRSCAAATVEMAVNYGLTDDEVARGYVLTCQSRPTTADVDVDYDA